MAALFELLNYMDRQEDRKLARQKAEVQMEIGDRRLRTQD